MEIEKLIDIVTSTDSNKLLEKAGKEIMRLKREVAALEASANYKFGNELISILRVSRPKGFRLVYAANPSEKEERSRDFVRMLSDSTGFDYDEAVTREVMIGCKEFESVEVLR